MAVNALGQTLQLLLNQAPQSDLSLGLKAGDVAQARLVEMLPDNRAIVQIKGLNLVAQLPAPQPGQKFEKGMTLDLAVLQSQPKPSGAPSSPSVSSQASAAALQTGPAAP